MQEWETFYTEETIEKLKRKYRKRNILYSVMLAVFTGGIGFIPYFLPAWSDAVTFIDKSGNFHYIGRLNGSVWNLAVVFGLLALAGLVHLFLKWRCAAAYEEFRIAREDGNINTSAWSSVLVVLFFCVVILVAVTAGGVALTHITLAEGETKISCRSFNENHDMTYQPGEIYEIWVFGSDEVTMHVNPSGGESVYIPLGKKNETVEEWLNLWDKKTLWQYQLMVQYQKYVEE